MPATVFGHSTRLPAMGDDDGWIACCILQPPVHQGGMFRSAGATIAGTKPQRVTRNNRTSTGGPWEVGDVVRAKPDVGSPSRCGRATKASRPSDTEQQHAISAISASFAARPDSAGRRRCFGAWFETRPKGSVDVRGLTSSDIDSCPMAREVRASAWGSTLMARVCWPFALVFT